MTEVESGASMELPREGQLGQGTAAHTYLTTLMATALLIAMGVATGSITARLLGPEGRGQLAALQLWPILMATAATFGMPQAIAYFCARFRSRGRQFFTAGLLLVVLICGPMAGIGYLLLPILLQSKGEAVVAGARIYLSYLPLFAIMTLAAEAMRGYGLFRLWNALRMVPTVAWFAIVLILAGFSHAAATGVSATSLANAYLIGLALVSMPLLAFTIGRLHGPIGDPRRVWASLLKFGLPVTGASIAFSLNLRLDQLVMTIITPARELGQYVVAVAWGGVVMPMLTALGSLILPRTAMSSDQGFQYATVSRAGRVGVLLAASLTIPGVAVTPLAIRLLFGEQFEAAIPSALTLVCAGAFLGIVYILTESLLGLGDPNGPLRAQLVGFATMALALAGLLPPLGILGAALASLLGYGANTAALLVEMRRRTRMPYKQLCMPKWNDVQVVLRATAGILRPGLRTLGEPQAQGVVADYTPRDIAATTVTRKRGDRSKRT